MTVETHTEIKDVLKKSAVFYEMKKRTNFSKAGENNPTSNSPFIERTLVRLIEQYGNPLDFAIRCAFGNLANNIESENEQTRILRLLVNNLKTQPSTLYEGNKLSQTLANITKELEAQVQENDPILMRQVSLLGSAYAFAGKATPKDYKRLEKEVGLQTAELKTQDKVSSPELAD